MSHLIMTRRTGEEVIATTPGERRIVFRIATVNGDRVTVAIEADRDIKVYRGEIQKLVDAEKGNQ